MARFTHEDANKRKKWSMAAYGSWQLANDGAATNGGGIVGDVIATAVGATFAKVYDEGTTTFANLEDSDDLTGWAAADQLLSDADAEQVNDAFYIGQAVPFCECAISGITAGTAATWGGDGGLWEFWNGSAWDTLPIILDNTDTTAQDGARTAQQDGAISFVPEATWATVAVDSQTAYWIRWRVTALQLTASPTPAAVSIVTPLDGFSCPHGGTITGIRVIDGTTGTVHSNDGIEFIVMNFTTGDHSGNKTWPINQRQDSFTGLTLAVNQGDELGVLCTQEDSGDEDPANVVLELQVSG